MKSEDFEKAGNIQAHQTAGITASEPAAQTLQDEALPPNNPAAQGEVLHKERIATDAPLSGGTSEGPAPQAKHPSGVQDQPAEISRATKSDNQSEGGGRIRRSLKILALIATGIIAYYQYLDQLIQTNIGREETLFSSTASQLDSHSDAVRASALSSLYELAFTRTPIETPPGLFSPLLNLAKWLVYPPAYRNYDRCATLFSEFAAAPRTPALGDRDMLSSQVISVGVSWIAKQSTIHDLQKSLPEQWLLYRAQVPKAYSPSLYLGKIEFSAANFSHSNMSYSTFDGSGLREANFEGATLTGVHFVNADLYGANLTNAHLDFAHLESVHLEQANLQGASLSNLASAEGAHFDGVTFIGTTLTGAHLGNASFRKARFVHADFAGADLNGSDFTEADLRGNDLRYASGLASVKSWRRALLRGAKLPPGLQHPASR